MRGLQGEEEGGQKKTSRERSGGISSPPFCFVHCFCAFAFVLLLGAVIGAMFCVFFVLCFVPGFALCFCFVLCLAFVLSLCAFCFALCSFVLCDFFLCCVLCFVLRFCALISCFAFVLCFCVLCALLCAVFLFGALFCDRLPLPFRVTFKSSFTRNPLSGDFKNTWEREEGTAPSLPPSSPSLRVSFKYSSTKETSIRRLDGHPSPLTSLPFSLIFFCPLPSAWAVSFFRLRILVSFVEEYLKDTSRRGGERAHWERGEGGGGSSPPPPPPLLGESPDNGFVVEEDLTPRREGAIDSKTTHFAKHKCIPKHETKHKSTKHSTAKHKS